MLSNTKQVICINDTGVTAAETATGVIDTLGWDYVSIDVIMSTSNDTTNNPSALAVSECDTSDGTFTNISGLVGDTDFTIPDAVTAGDWGAKLNCDCRARARWLKVSVAPLTTQQVTCIANLSRGDNAAIDATSAGVKVLAEA